MSPRGAEKEGFIDLHQLWPFYRRRRFSDETMEQIEATERLIEAHCNPRNDPDRPIVSRNTHRRANVK